MQVDVENGRRVGRLGAHQVGVPDFVGEGAGHTVEAPERPILARFEGGAGGGTGAFHSQFRPLCSIHESSPPNSVPAYLLAKTNRKTKPHRFVHDPLPLSRLLRGGLLASRCKPTDAVRQASLPALEIAGL